MPPASTLKALILCECMPRVFSGSSGGSIVAGVLAIHTDEEMIRDMIQDDIAVRFDSLLQSLLS